MISVGIWKKIIVSNRSKDWDHWQWWIFTAPVRVVGLSSVKFCTKGLGVQISGVHAVHLNNKDVLIV